MRRRWFVLTASLVIAALVVWAVADARDDPAREEHAAPTHTRPAVGGPSGQAVTQAGYDAAANEIINPSTKTGGTLQLLTASDCDSWDPARTSYGWCWNLQRLITRTLVGYTTVNGTDFKLGPDLATSLGRHNADYSQWTYTLQPGLRFSTGRPITPLDVKYGIERLFAVDVINGGPSAYFINSIAHPSNYAGPYRDGDLKTITTTSDSITFRLSGPNADFDHLMALPAAAPVPHRVEGGPKYTGATYGLGPVASGPFEIRAYHPRNSVTLVRNPYWQQATDRIRHPLVDAVDLTVDRNLRDIDKRLAAGSADARADGGVQPAFGARIMAMHRSIAPADDPVRSATRYLAISPAVIPNAHCRRAIFYAIDKAAAVRVFGGPTAGVAAKAMTAPGIEGWVPSFDPYPSGPSGAGDVALAKRELRLCGRPQGFATQLIYATPSEFGPALFKAEQKALGRVGIRITVPPGNAGPAGCTYASPASLRRAGVGLVFRTLSAGYPTGLGFYRQESTRSTCLEDQSTNLNGLHDATVNGVLAAAAHGQATYQDWELLDRAVMRSTTYLPLIWTKTLYYRNPRLTNVACDNAIASGVYDFVNVGVA